MSDRTYLFEYYFEGECYGITVVASSPDEAARKIRRVSSAQYKGEVFATISASPRALLVTIRDFFLRIRSARACR